MILYVIAAAVAAAGAFYAAKRRKRSAVRLRLFVNTQEWEVGKVLLLTNGQKVDLLIQPVDAYGNAARVDGVPVWSVSDASMGSVSPSADGMTATFTTAGPLGTVQVNVQADADLGQGLRTIAATLDIQIESGEAVALSIVAGVPQPK